MSQNSNHVTKMTEDGFTIVSKKSKKNLRKESSKEFKFTYKSISNSTEKSLETQVEKNLQDYEKIK